jgi:hypothetical protein
MHSHLAELTTPRPISTIHQIPYALSLSLQPVKGLNVCVSRLVLRRLTFFSLQAFDEVYSIQDLNAFIHLKSIYYSIGFVRIGFSCLF